MASYIVVWDFETHFCSYFWYTISSDDSDGSFAPEGKTESTEVLIWYVGQFYVTWTQVRVVFEDGLSIENMPP